MVLFLLSKGEMFPTEDCLNIYPFSEIWRRDTHVTKDLAKRELSYIAYLTDPKKENPFYGYPWNLEDEDQTRSLKIIENKFKEYPDWQPDELVKEAVIQQQEFFYHASPKLSYYESQIIAAKKVENFLRKFDINEKNFKTGAPIYTVKGITDGLKNADDVLAKLDAMEERVYQELYDKTKTKGNKVINSFEE